MRLGTFIKMLNKVGISLPSFAGKIVTLVYDGVSAGAPSALTNAGGLAKFTDKFGGALYLARNGVWDRLGGGYIAVDTYANIAALTGYPAGTEAFASDVNLPVRYNGSVWEPTETIYSVAPIRNINIKTSPPNTASYTQSGNTISVAWTTHGIPDQYNGGMVYLPASTSIAAGWYYDFTWVSANAFTARSLVSQTVSSETPASNTAEINMPTVLNEPSSSGLIPTGAQMQVGLYWDAKNSAVTKTLRTYSYGVLTNTPATRTTSSTISAVTSSTIIPCAGGKFFIVGSNPSTPVSKIDTTHKITMQSSATDSWVAVVAGFMQVRK